ncbi:hypothetical protein TSOC_009569 [Tetrabaena socialis]|uniref:Uncharacterized protein n=1 Tax=Tetrabaena socialis TaxID=47790 RepID=A0A2J7ZVJ5_9CHLO|nr:hypothetical protein TSOC_009569 [Tetrabaena socialis]|eukprot:PNH04284.1 hypothetical protein TSOC_009569 [Tetrabaena socialis]
MAHLNSAGGRSPAAAAAEWDVPGETLRRLIDAASALFVPCELCHAVRQSRDSHVSFLDIDDPEGRPFCHFCRPTDPDVRLVQVRRNTYHDVVRIADLAKLCDVGAIQTYTINNGRVIFLKSRPQPPKLGASGPTCVHCHRALMDSGCSFCSLECKLNRRDGHTPLSALDVRAAADSQKQVKIPRRLAGGGSPDSGSGGPSTAAAAAGVALLEQSHSLSPPTAVHDRSPPRALHGRTSASAAAAAVRAAACAGWQGRGGGAAAAAGPASGRFLSPRAPVSSLPNGEPSPAAPAPRQRQTPQRLVEPPSPPDEDHQQHHPQWQQRQAHQQFSYHMAGAANAVDGGTPPHASRASARLAAGLGRANSAPAAGPLAASYGGGDPRQACAAPLAAAAVAAAPSSLATDLLALLRRRGDLTAGPPLFCQPAAAAPPPAGPYGASASTSAGAGASEDGVLVPVRAATVLPTPFAAASWSAGSSAFEAALNSAFGAAAPADAPSRTTRRQSAGALPSAAGSQGFRAGSPLPPLSRRAGPAVSAGPGPLGRGGGGTLKRRCASIDIVGGAAAVAMVATTLYGGGGDDGLPEVTSPLRPAHRGGDADAGRLADHLALLSPIRIRRHSYSFAPATGGGSGGRVTPPLAGAGGSSPDSEGEAAAAAVLLWSLPPVWGQNAAVAGGGGGGACGGGLGAGLGPEAAGDGTDGGVPRRVKPRKGRPQQAPVQ